MTKLESLKNKLLYRKRNGWLGISKNKSNEIFKLSDSYKQFLNVCKTERETIAFIEKISQKHGYKNSDNSGKKSKKLFINIKGTAGALVNITDIKSFASGFLMNGAHIDTPRIDIKQNPLYESLEMAYLKTHYYGGIKKYQWVSRPLAIHGFVVTAKGKKINITIGEDLNDPVFTINDLLPHLAANQMEKSASKIIEGEQLNILFGSIPYSENNKSSEANIDDGAIKLALIEKMYHEYGITEHDLLSAELQLVPAGSARDVGLDRSFVGSYGQDDRICTYLGLKALLDLKEKELSKNSIMLFFNKEEIGSVGPGGADTNLIQRVVNKILNYYNINDHSLLLSALENSSFLSSDVSAGVDPEWKDVTEIRNAGQMGKGVCLTKYTGVKGKSGSNDASAEFSAAVINAFNKGNVIWQNAELGKVDQGGGGTIAKFAAYWGMDVIDCGPPILSMHGPFEIASKVDIYNTYKAYQAFFKYL